MKRRTEEKIREFVSQQDSTLPVDVHNVAKKLGISIVEEKLPDEVSGVLYSPKPGATMIVLNKAQSARRKRFSIAHEIGHFVLSHHTEVHVDKKMLFRDEVSSAAIDPVEIEANAFAAELLMPAEAVRLAFQEVIKLPFEDEDELLQDLSARFDVSQAAIGYRLKNLGLSVS